MTRRTNREIQSEHFYSPQRMALVYATSLTFAKVDLPDSSLIFICIKVLQRISGQEAVIDDKNQYE